MTREQAKEIYEMIETHGIEVIKAYGEGRTIQHLNLDGEWVDCDMPISFSNNHSFRIKPEENYTIKQNCGENRVEGGVLSVSGSVLEMHTCKECVGETVFRGKKAYCKNKNCDLPACDNFKPKEKRYHPFNNCEELIEHYQKKYKSAVGCDIYFPSLYKPCIWVRDKTEDAKGDIELITGFTEHGNVLLNGTSYPLQHLFQMYEFLDGSPCGVEE